MGKFSSAIRVADVNDFLAPATACVLPLGGGALVEPTDKNAVTKPAKEPKGSVLAPIVPVQSSNAGGARAKVTVSDCLACTGCVTSADTVLLSTESLDKLRQVMSDAEAGSRLFPVAALSQQAVASIAVKYGMDMGTTARKLSTFLRKVAGFAAVLDLAFARHFTLLEASSEFLTRYKAGKTLTVSSTCPGWLTYAEKTQDASVLESVSAVRSTQGVCSLLARQLMPKCDKRKLWICSVMPCHDKKLEAIRPEFVRRVDDGSEERDVDCVVTTGELVQLIDERNFDLKQAPESGFDEPLSESVVYDFGIAVGSGSGGLADFVLRRAASELLGITLPSGQLPFQNASKSGDLKSITVSSEDGKAQLSFATAYGFRCLQSILRKMRRGECAYNYIELMACPGGCNNGGGQLEAPTAADDSGQTMKQQANAHLQAVNKAFAKAQPVADPLSVVSVRKMYENVIGGPPGGEESRDKLSISVTSRKSAATTIASLEW